MPRMNKKRSGPEAKVSKFKTKKVRERKYKYKSGSTPTPDNFHPDSIAYMKSKLGRNPRGDEAIELDREWAQKKLNEAPTGESLRLLMGEKTSQPSGGKRSLASRQFNDFVDTGKADLSVTEPNYNVRPAEVHAANPRKKRNRDDEQQQAV